MKLSLVRIYPEAELHSKLRQTEALLQKLEQETTDHRFCDTPALKELWVKFEATRYIVTESLLMDSQYCRDDAQSLFVEREVEDDYTNELQDEEGLHNKLISLQLRMDSLLSSQNYMTYYIDKSMYINKREAVIEIASDIYRHLDHTNPGDMEKMDSILTWLNDIYLYDDEDLDVVMDEVERSSRIKEAQQEDLLSALKSSLNLIEDTTM